LYHYQNKKQTLQLWRPDLGIKRDKGRSAVKKMNIKFKIIVGFGILLAGCSQHTPIPEGLLLSGACKVEIHATPRSAEIVLDGIPLGKGQASVELPCGEKRLVIKQKGYVPYYSYHNVDKDQSLRIDVTLEPRNRARKDFAMSQEIVDQIREGLPVWDLSQGPRPEVPEGSFPSYLGDMASLIASVKGADASAATGSEGAFEQGVWDSVEDWR
jgi:hypothetical protein